MFRETQVKKVEEKDMGYAREVQTPEGKYFLLFGYHDEQQQVPKNLKEFSACVIETGGINWSDQKENAEAIKNIRGRLQYGRLVSELNKNGIPIILADPITDERLAKVMAIDNHFITQTIRFLVSMGLAEYVAEKAEELIERRGINRRILLKGLLAGGALLKTAEPLVTSFTARLHYDKIIGHEPSSTAIKLKEMMSPEIYLIILTFRNAVIAYKERFLMRTKKQNLGNNPGGKSFNIATVLGEAHVGIESMINMSDKALLNIIKTLKPIAIKLCNKESIWRIVECLPQEVQKEEEINGMITHRTDYDYKFKITDEPELKQIFFN